MIVKEELFDFANEVKDEFCEIYLYGPDGWYMSREPYDNTSAAHSYFSLMSGDMLYQRFENGWRFR